VKKTIFICLFAFVFMITTACSGAAQPTSIPVPTSTFTAVPTLTVTHTLTSTPLLPTKIPPAASAWNGIPIMPGAVTGDGDDEGYVFTIKATPRQIQQYYQLELGKLGWGSFVEGDGVTSLTLTFTNDASEMLTVSVLTKGEEALVLLVK
jgi:hypothetical protein